MKKLKQAYGDLEQNASEELAKNVASLPEQTVNLSDERYMKLNVQLMKHGAMIAERGTAFVSAVDDAIPKLAEMRSLLSQRSATRDKTAAYVEFQSWTKWLKDFLRNHKIEYSIRQIGRKIDAYEQAQDPNHASRPKRNTAFALGQRPPKATDREAERGLLREMAVAALDGQPFDELVSRCAAMGIVTNEEVQSARKYADIASGSGSEKTSEHRMNHAVMLNPDVFKPGNDFSSS